MIAIFSLLFTLGLSLLVTRIAAMALMLTGLSRESARFQSRSAFTGVGFTTSEAESIVNHPIRRRIVMMLMLLGNVGIATVAATVMLSFLQTTQEKNFLIPALLLSFGLLFLWFLATNRKVERQLNRIIAWTLRYWGKLEVRDYVAILQLEGGFAVSELMVETGDWLLDRNLIELRLPQEGVLILGIRRKDGTYLGTPTGDTIVQLHDTLTLYGHIERIEELDRRRKGSRGDAAHQTACIEHEEMKEQQQSVTAAETME